MDVLWQLQGEPTHATRERYRADRERLVRQPMIAMLNEVADTDPGTRTSPSGTTAPTPGGGSTRAR